MNTLIKKYPGWTIACIAIVIVSIYWNSIASDRFVSQSNVVLESPQIASPSISVQSLFSGGGGGNGDMLLLRDYLLSVDMMKKIENELSIKAHYSDESIDFISRMKKNPTLEEFHEYYLSRTSIELDEYAQVLRLKIEAFNPEMAQKLSYFLLDKGEDYMNLMGQRLAEEQVKFLEIQVQQLNTKFIVSQNELLDYQNEYGLISPVDTVRNVEAVASAMESELAKLKANKIQLLSYQSKTSPDIIRTDSQIEALKQQIAKERSRVTEKSGNALNKKSSEYTTLELKAKFAQDSYSLALGALENTRIEAARKLKQVSILQEPTLPEYAIEPRRLHNSAVFAILVIFLGLIGQMLVLIIRDHRD